MMTIPVKYVGVKEDHVDDLFKTGAWTPGEVKLVPEEIVPYMLFHHDVYEDARSAAARKKKPIIPTERPRPYMKLDRVDNEAPLANLPMMDKAALAQYAEANFQHRFEYDKVTAAQMRQQIVGLIRQRSA